MNNPAQRPPMAGAISVSLDPHGGVNIILHGPDGASIAVARLEPTQAAELSRWIANAAQGIDPSPCGGNA